MSISVSDAHLISVFKKVEKIVKETEVYFRKIEFKDVGGIDEDDELLFPLEVGHEMYTKALKVYLESKDFIDKLDSKALSKYVDKVNKNEKAAALLKQHNNNIASNGNSHQNNNNNNTNGISSSSSSDDDSGENEKENGRKHLKRKSKEASSNGSGSSNTTTTTSSSSSSANTYTSVPSTQKTKRIKPPSESPKNVPETSSMKEEKVENIPPPSSKQDNSIPQGTLVCAKEKSNWILAKVNSFNSKTQKYEVIDEDEEESKRFNVAIKDIIQLPNPNSITISYATNAKVLAMFPDTTTFYPALVVSSTKVKNKTTQYILHFDDDQGENGQTPSRRVSAQYVVQMR